MQMNSSRFDKMIPIQTHTLHSGVFVDNCSKSASCLHPIYLYYVIWLLDVYNSFEQQRNFLSTIMYRTSIALTNSHCFPCSTNCRSFSNAGCFAKVSGASVCMRFTLLVFTRLLNKIQFINSALASVVFLLRRETCAAIATTMEIRKSYIA